MNSSTMVDAHMHIGTWDHPDFLGRSCTMADASGILIETGLSGAVICPTDQCKHESLLDDMRAEIAKHASLNYWFFPWFKPSSGPGAESSLDWISSHSDHVSGLKIHPSLSKARISDPEFAPALKLAEEHEWVVLVHCGRWQEKASYRFAIDAAQRHPSARFLLAHGGGDTPPLATAAAEMVLERKIENVWFEFSGLREYWVIERNVKRLGAERYLMGSDYGLAHPSMYIGAVRAMNLSEGDKAKILGENARSILGEGLKADAPT